MSAATFLTSHWGKLVPVALLMVIAVTVVVLLSRGEPNGVPPKLAEAGARPSVRTPPAPARRFRILHVMSYHSPWVWTDRQLRGFQGELKDLDVEYRVFEMDAKRRSSEACKAEAGAQARRLIDTWLPDLVFTGDDDAQQYVARHYVNGEIPFVFCAVNADPRDYGFVGSRNVTGVLEVEHYVQSVRLLKALVPGVRRIAVLTDTGPMWDRVMRRMKAAEGRLDGVRVVAYEVMGTFRQYRQKVRDYEGKVDALGMLGIFEFRDANGLNVPYQEVARWTADHSRLPDFSFWQDRIPHGTLCAVTVSGFEQGEEAGRIARAILLEGRSPGSFPMKATVKGEPVINLARARRLGIQPSSSLLLTARIVTKFAWETE